MTTVSFPSTLPTATISGYSLTHYDPVVRTEMDSGTIRARRRFENVPGRASIRWVMDRCEFAFFESWFYNTIKSGADWFKYPLPVGSSNEETEVRFMGIYQSRPLGTPDIWEVSAQLEVRTPDRLSLDYLELLNDFNAKELDGFGERLEELLQEKLPSYVWSGG